MFYWRTPYSILMDNGAKVFLYCKVCAKMSTLVMVCASVHALQVFSNLNYISLKPWPSELCIPFLFCTTPCSLEEIIFLFTGAYFSDSRNTVVYCITIVMFPSSTTNSPILIILYMFLQQHSLNPINNNIILLFSIIQYRASGSVTIP